MIPDEKGALLLHQKYGSDVRIVEHCETVRSVASVLVMALSAKGVPVNERAVTSAALLHDIGRTRTQTVHHGHVGAELLREEGVDDVVLEIVKKHVGAGISKEESISLGFPDGDYLPRTTEEKIVCFSDKMVGSNQVRPFEEEVRRFIRKGHDVGRLRILKEDIARLMEEDPETVIFSRLEHSTPRSAL